MVPVSSKVRQFSRGSRPAGLFVSVLALLFALGLLALWAGGAGAAAPTAKTQPPAQTNPAAKISSTLRDEFAADADGKVRYLVVLKEQADLTNNIRDWNAKGRYVLDKLRQTANATQPQVLATLQTQQTQGSVERFKSYYIINAFQVVGNFASVENLAALSEVGYVATFPVVTLDEPLERVAAPEGGTGPPEWNVERVNAPEAWAMGYDGTGMTIGSLDTGTRWTHEALKPSYRGWNGSTADHNYNWWDPVAGQPAPYDDNGHGTHTMGTILGVDVEPGDDINIGVAPGAKWISTNGIADGASDGDIIEAGEFMLAPWDLNKQNPNPALRPVVVSNSWGYGVNSLACPGGDPLEGEFFRGVVGAWIAAGIFPSFSAGNGFPQGNRIPAAYPETFETGALSKLELKASYSSEGPSCYDQRQHPQIMAYGGDEGPGLQEDYVRSSYPGSDTEYEYLVGTSMAQPATAGAVAILKQANPDLTIQETWYILTSTASFDPAWGVRPNPLYGWGRLQIDDAVEAALGMADPTVTGTPPTATVTRTPTITRTPTQTLQPTATPACSISYYSTDVPKTILGIAPDPLASPVTSTLVITNGPTIAALEVISLTISHTYPDDLQVALISPAGTRVVLFNGGCGSVDWTAANTGFTLSDRANIPICEVTPPGQASYMPQQPLAAFNGQPSSGTWKLEIIDDTPPDGGTLHAWGLRIFGNAPCDAPAGTSTATATVTGTPPTATATATACAVEFQDVPESNDPSSFYPYVRCLACRGIVSGYPCGGTNPETGQDEPCGVSGDAYYRPANQITRGQISKVVAGAAGLAGDPGEQKYQDVPPNSTFYAWINRLSDQGVMGGYPCGGPGEPCQNGNRPYFRPGANATRGQISKIVSNAAGFDEMPSGQSFEDVPPDDSPSSYYQYVERLYLRGVISGYACGGDDEPCGDDNRPYFRPNANVTRGQAAKIVSNTFYPNCQTAGSPAR